MEQTPKLEKLTYTTQEVAQLLGTSEDTIQAMVKKKIIRPLLIQKHPFLFLKSEVARVMKDMVSSQYYKEE